MSDHRITRRNFTALAAAGAMALGIRPSFAATPEILTRPIPKTGEHIPSVGMGTWITFNVGGSERLRNERVEVLRAFFEHGGGMIDSSPMYGSAEDVLGYCFNKLETTEGLFSATKVWTGSDGEGREQIADSFRLWRINKFDLFQVHNLLNTDGHMPYMKEKKQAGEIRYLGVTTSHGWRHDGILDMMDRDEIDFVQFTYNIEDREAEARLLPTAADKGIATIINRPFQRGGLTNRLEGKPLPGFAAEYGIETWAQYLLKFVISHPAVTCAIPATSQVVHMHENMNAMRGLMPDAKVRQRMIDYVESL